MNIQQISQSFYKGAQTPVAWLRSAERLRDAAEVILSHEQQFEIPFFRACDLATQQATAIAYSEGNKSGSAEIECSPPNYPPAQLLYAYAIENVLKGILVANNPSLANENKLNKSLLSHDLNALARMADFQVYVQETPVLDALSKLSVWAGRYPVASRRSESSGAKNSDELLDWGSQNLIVRQFFARGAVGLENKIDKSPTRFGAIVVFRQPGT